MSNTYQKTSRRAQLEPLPGEIAVPEQVIVSMTEIAGAAKEGLLALAVGTGLQVMAAMFDEDVTRLCGPEGRHNADRAGYRHGTGDGSVTLGGRRVPVTRPRVRAADGSGELRLASYDLFSSADILGQLAMEKMLAGLSSRRYRDGLEPVGSGIVAQAGATSKSAVSRRFVAATETALAGLMSRRLDDLDLVAFLVDGVHFGEHCCVVALGIGIDGTKHPLSLAEGSTENKTLVTGLITDLRDRGLDVTQARPGGDRRVEGAGRGDQGGLRQAGHPKMPGTQDQKRDRQATRPAPAGHPAADPPGLPRRICAPGRGHAVRAGPRAGQDPSRRRGQLREGMTETLSVLALGVPPTLARTLRSTNSIESMIGICRDHSRNVKKWRDGTMALRWCAAGMLEAGHQFRRVNGHLHLPKLRAALQARFDENVSTARDDDNVKAA